MTLHKQIPFNSCLGVDSAENMIEWFDKQVGVLANHGIISIEIEEWSGFHISIKVCVY